MGVCRACLPGSSRLSVQVTPIQRIGFQQVVGAASVPEVFPRFLQKNTCITKLSPHCRRLFFARAAGGNAEAVGKKKSSLEKLLTGVSRKFLFESFPRLRTWFFEICVVRLEVTQIVNS